MGDDHPPPWIVDGVDLRQEFPRMLLGPANREGPNHLPTTMEEEVEATAAPTGVATRKVVALFAPTEGGGRRDNNGGGRNWFSNWFFPPPPTGDHYLESIPMHQRHAVLNIFTLWQHQKRMRLQAERVRFARYNRMLSTGVMHSVALTPNGDVHCWGLNMRGEAPPEGIEHDPDDPFTAVSAGGGYSVALSKNGNLHFWGSNHRGQAPPQGVMTGEFVDVCAGDSHTVAVTRDGHVRFWGLDAFGEASPDVFHDGTFIAVSTYQAHSLALRSNGTIACWGRNDCGQAPPVGVDGDFKAISAGTFHSVAIRRNGNLHFWGGNKFNQAPEEDAVGDFVAVAAGDFHTIAITREGHLRSWGDNAYNQSPLGPLVYLGLQPEDYVLSRDNDNIIRPTDIPIPLVNIATNLTHTLALGQDEHIATFGRSDYGQAPLQGVFGPFALPPGVEAWRPFFSS